MRLIMIFFDSNVILYALLNQDLEKKQIAVKLIQKSLGNETLVISPLVIT